MPLSNTHLAPNATRALLARARHLHFLGVCGVQMRALAHAALARGFHVTGSDTAPEPIGLPVFPEADLTPLQTADAVVFTLAIDPRSPALSASLARGIPRISRADFLAFLTSDFPLRLAVAGAHGKSTVTAMTAHILCAAGKSPTVFGGAEGVSRVGGDDLSLCEACEYRDSFLSLSPTHGAILNVELDHVDYFRTKEALLSSFATFASRCEILIYQTKGADLGKIARQHQKALGFGQGGEVTALDVRRAETGHAFTLSLFGERTSRVQLQVPGAHNVQNALAAAALSHLSGVNADKIAEALSSFKGLPRRLESVGRYRGARVISDYAHHPSEVAASLAALRESSKTGRVFILFQPHTYSRTAAFLSPLATALSAADGVIVTDVYAAREQNECGVTPGDLVRAIGQKAHYANAPSALTGLLPRDLCEDDVLALMAAGPISPWLSALSL